MSENRKPEQGIKLRGAEKVARIPVKVIPTVETPRKPDWIRVKMAAPEEVQRIKSTLREQKLHTVCEEAACPNLPECFGGGTATLQGGVFEGATGTNIFSNALASTGTGNFGVAGSIPTFS